MRVNLTITDIDECANISLHINCTESDNEVCISTEGSYNCMCLNGYSRDSPSADFCQGKNVKAYNHLDDSSCTLYTISLLIFLIKSDINECEDDRLNECSHACNNTNGSFVCHCPPELTLNDDMFTCKSKLALEIYHACLLNVSIKYTQFPMIILYWLAVYLEGLPSLLFW